MTCDGLPPVTASNSSTSDVFPAWVVKAPTASHTDRAASRFSDACLIYRDWPLHCGSGQCTICAVASTRPVGRKRTNDGEAPSLSTLAKSLTILDALALTPSSEGRSHADLAAELGLRRSTLYRYLATMESQGLVEPVGDSRYRLGPRILALAAAAADERSFVSEAKEFVNALATATGETAHATIYDNGEVVTVEIADG